MAEVKKSVWSRLGNTLRKKSRSSLSHALDEEREEKKNAFAAAAAAAAASKADLSSTSDDRTPSSDTVAGPFSSRLPINLSDTQNANFLWSPEAEEMSNASEEEGDPYYKKASMTLRRSDYLSREETDLSVDAKNYLGDDSSAIGYVYTSRDTQEIIQTESSSWCSEEDDKDNAARPSYKNWHDGFQRISSRISSFNKTTPSTVRIDAYNELILMTEDFLLAARIFGRIIISEAHLPLEQKTVPPLSSLGGVIGGQKFLVQGILFKFSSDNAGIFGPNADVISAKISGHELKGLAAANSFDQELICPMMALIDFKGFRLIAMTQLPIGKETLCVGSSDGGQTVANGSPALFEKMAKLGGSLNLKGHWTGPKEQEPLFLHTPIDLEGHVIDGKMYLCDFSRLMPPEKPSAHNKQSYLYELMRREYVLLVDRPLSSDAFSRFTKHHPQHKIDNREVGDATHHLYLHIIPAVAADLESLLQFKSDYSVTQFRMSSMLHSNGVNVRHLFRIFQHLTGKTARALVLVEMVSRVLVQDVRRKLRDTTRKLPVSMVEGYYLQVLQERFNLIFGNSSKSTGFWNKYVRKEVWHKFCHHIGRRVTPEAVAKYPMFSRNCSFKAASMTFTFSNGMVSMHAVFFRMQQILGFSLKPAIEAQLVNFSVFVRLCAKPNPFRFSDFDDLGMRVKHMNLVSYAKGFLYLNQGLDARASDPKAATRFLQMSIKNFEDALADNTSSKVTLRACAKALFYFDEEARRADFQKNKSSGNVGRESSFVSEESTKTTWEASPYLARADLYFRRAILADPTDAESLYMFAFFLDRTGNKDSTEDFYKRALKADANHVEALKGYGDFLSDQGRFQESEMLYLLAREASRLKGSGEGEGRK